MIHICFAIHDANGCYSMYTGAAIQSLLMNTRENVCIHILHDGTLTSQNRDKFRGLIQTYDQEVKFYLVEMPPILMNTFSLNHFSIATIFRLGVLKYLPKGIDRLIYLDSDMIINLDIRMLWKENIVGFPLGACKDSGVTGNEVSVLCEQGVLDWKCYFNAGVLLMDLGYIRKNFDLWNEGICFLRNHPESGLPDQDALNYIFSGKVCYLPQCYNQFVWIEKSRGGTPGKKIYHYTGGPDGNIRIHAVDMDPYDQMFFYYLLRSPWEDFFINTVYTKMLSDRIIMRQAYKLMQVRMKSCQVGLWGYGARIETVLRERLNLEKLDFYIDNNPLKWTWPGETRTPTFSPEILRILKPNEIIIISAVQHFSEVKAEISEYGLTENVHFFDGRAFLEQSRFDDVMKATAYMHK